jgi:uncharacterized DUF497 family protein
MNFFWDENKARVNQQKHGISFIEESTVFGDPLSITIDDPEHSNYEKRFIIIRYSSNLNMLVVAHTDVNNFIRIISARKATKKERSFYENI